jgi:hypothetical protein
MLRTVKTWLFGVIAPGLEVLLVMIGLGLLGWEGVMYTIHRKWTIIRLANVGVQPHGADSWQTWLSGLPLSGTCIVVAIALFFILPPSYAHD